MEVRKAYFLEAAKELRLPHCTCALAMGARKAPKPLTQSAGS